MELFDEFLVKKQPNLPFKLNRQGFIIILDDSNKIPDIDSLSNLLKNENSKENVLILRHHNNLAINDKLRKYTNTIELIDKKTLENSFKDLGLINIIYGDGAPNMCFKHGNVIHTWNNIKANSNIKDSVIILKNGRKYIYELSE